MYKKNNKLIKVNKNTKQKENKIINDKVLKVCIKNCVQM